MIDWGDFWNFFKTGVPRDVLIPSFLLMLFALGLVIFSGRVRNKRNSILWILLVEYLFIVLCSTVICRNRMVFEFARFEPSPLWTYIAVINRMPGVSVWDIVLNVVLFMPMGFLLGCIYPSIKIYRLVIVVLGCSLLIETSQYLLEKGVAQTDDLLHNIVGAVVGCFMAKGLMLYRSKHS